MSAKSQSTTYWCGMAHVIGQRNTKRKADILNFPGTMNPTRSYSQVYYK